MRSDPFGVYADRQSRDETLRPTGNAAGGFGSGDGGGLSWLIVGILLGVVLLIGYQRYVQPDDGDGRGDRDRQDQRDDDDKREDKKQDDKKDQQASVKLKTLVFVHERDPQAIEHDLLLRQMDEWCRSRGIDGYRALDDDMQDDQVKAAKAFAESKGVSSPFVLGTDASNKPVRVIKWPASIEGLEELLK